METTELKTGSMLQDGKYRIFRTLGQGGFGITYEAEQVSLGRKVAVKEFFMKEYCNRDAGTSHVSVPSIGSRELVGRFRDKFIKEARMIAGFNHPNIVKVHDVFEEHGTAYYVMEYLEDKSLHSLVQEKGRLSEEAAKGYIGELAQALGYIHGKGVLHLDVKPSNVMLGNDGHAVLIDFGISKHIDSDGHLTSSTPLGMSRYYAPLEQIAQESGSTYSAATDIYSLGATLYFLLTGKRPPEASALSKGLSTDELKAAGVSVNTINAVRSAMMLFKGDRPQSVEAFLALLDGKTQGGNAGSQEREKRDEDETLTYGTLRVSSMPDGAKVFVDGVQIGSTKGSLETRLDPGAHIVRIEKAGYDAVERNVTITAGQTLEIKAGLEMKRPAAGWIGVVAGLAAAALIVLLLIWRPWDGPNQEVEDIILSDTTLVAEDIMQSLPSTAIFRQGLYHSQEHPEKQKQQGSVKISSSPTGAQIWLDGKNTGRSTDDLLEGLEVGSHSLRLVLDGHEPYMASLEIKAGRQERSYVLKEKPALAKPAVQAGSNRINGHEYVDLGLSVKWATCNVGASSPEGYGSYFAWGETSPKGSYDWENLKYCNDNTGDSFSKYNQNQGGTRDNRTRLELSDDAARANWGGSWRMPTKSEMDELKEQCIWQWTTQNGHKGYKVTSRKNGSSIFFPAAGYRNGSSSFHVSSYGYYWSSSLDTNDSYNAYNIYSNNSNIDWSYSFRRFGLSVRPVIE